MSNEMKAKKVHSFIRSWIFGSNFLDIFLRFVFMIEIYEKNTTKYLKYVFLAVFFVCIMTHVKIWYFWSGWKLTLGKKLFDFSFNKVGTVFTSNKIDRIDRDADREVKWRTVEFWLIPCFQHSVFLINTFDRIKK